MIAIGPAGWSYGDWGGIVYPRRKPKGFHALAHLARYVEHVEINSSFYQALRAQHAKRWLQELEFAPRFTLSAKLQDVFTHRELPSDMRQRDALVRAWLEGVEPLRESGRLRAVLVQFPVSFREHAAHRERLRTIQACFGHLPLVLELRHRSWFRRQSLRFVESLGCSLAHVDLPPAPEHPPEDFPRIGPIGYLRLHGRNAQAWFDPQAGRDQRYDYLYSLAEIERLAGLGGRITQGSDEAYGVTNNHFSGKAMVNALEWMSLAGKTQLKAPLELLEAYPRLRSRVQVDGQDSLFS